MSIGCCKDCQERVPACHATCEKYLTAKAKHDKIKEEMRKERDCRQSIIGIQIQKFEKYKKRHSR